MPNQIITFGCRLNSYESQIIDQNLQNNPAEQDLIIFNSCAVTSEAERQLGQAIRKANRQNPDKKIVITGCAAQINPEKYANMPEVYRVLGNQEKFEAKNYQEEFTQGKNTPDPAKNINQSQEIQHKDQIFFETRQKNEILEQNQQKNFGE